MAIDTLFLCFAEDVDRNGDGASRPYIETYSRPYVESYRDVRLKL